MVPQRAPRGIAFNGNQFDDVLYLAFSPSSFHSFLFAPSMLTQETTSKQAHVSDSGTVGYGNDLNSNGPERRRIRRRRTRSSG